jgi:4-aminobutyrate aminotransferase-like enzyme
LTKVQEIIEDQTKKGVPISGLVIEPIQAEGGDNHASKEFFQVKKGGGCDKNMLHMLLCF